MAKFKIGDILVQKRSDFHPDLFAKIQIKEINRIPDSDWPQNENLDTFNYIYEILDDYAPAHNLIGTTNEDIEDHLLKHYWLFINSPKVWRELNG